MHADGERSAPWGMRSVQAAQPIEESEVLRQAAEDRLHQVHVRLHQAGHEVAAGTVHDLGIRWRLLDRADLRDARAAHEHVRGDRARAVGHREERSAAQQDRH